MFTINDDLSIYVTRGDIVHIAVSAVSENEPYIFKVGDVVRIKIFGKKDCADVVFQKDFPVTTAGETVEVFLAGYETRIGGVISKHVDYWYEIELNPDSNPQTIIGYDDDGAKIFRLFPEGRNMTKDDPDITPEDIPIVDEELDITSSRPVENQAIVRGIERTAQRVTKELNDTISEEVDSLNGTIRELNTTIAEEVEQLENSISNNASLIQELHLKVKNTKEALEDRIATNTETAQGLATTITETEQGLKNSQRVFIADSPDINPADILGGEWELFDKEFEPHTWMDWQEKEYEYGLSYRAHISGHLLKLCAIFVPHSSISDMASFDEIFRFETLGFNKEELEISTLQTSVAHVYIGGSVLLAPVRVTGDGGCMIKNIGSEYIPAGAEYHFDVIIPATSHKQMLDNYCNKFYWRRIERYEIDLGGNGEWTPDNYEGVENG